VGKGVWLGEVMVVVSGTEVAVITGVVVCWILSYLESFTIFFVD
jgi:hypothetical protein